MNTDGTPCVQKSSKAIVEVSVLVHHISRKFQFSWSCLLIFSPTAGASPVLEWKSHQNASRCMWAEMAYLVQAHWAKDSDLIQCCRGHCTSPQELTGFLRNHIVTHSYLPQTPLTTVPCHPGHSWMRITEKSAGWQMLTEKLQLITGISAQVSITVTFLRVTSATEELHTYIPELTSYSPFLHQWLFLPFPTLFSSPQLLRQASLQETRRKSKKEHRNSLFLWASISFSSVLARTDTWYWLWLLELLTGISQLWTTYEVWGKVFSCTGEHSSSLRGGKRMNGAQGNGTGRSPTGEAQTHCCGQSTYFDAGVALKNKPKRTEVLITSFTSQLHVRRSPPLKRQRRFLGLRSPSENTSARLVTGKSWLPALHSLSPSHATFRGLPWHLHAPLAVRPRETAGLAWSGSHTGNIAAPWD